MRQYLLRKKFRAILLCKNVEGKGKRLLYSHMRKITTENFGTKYFAVSLYKRTQPTGQGSKPVVPGRPYRLPEDGTGGTYYTLEAREQHQDSKEKSKNELVVEEPR